jgi:uncharacterized protein (TIGR03435 family)
MKMLSELLAAVLFVVVPVAQSSPQSPSEATLTFEVASVKPGDTTDPREIRGGGCRGSDTPGFMAGGPIVVPLGSCRFVGVTLKMLVNAAESVGVESGPSWMDSTRFLIEGKAVDTSTVTRAQLTQMLQQLLRDRFKVKLHRQTKEVSGYALVIAKGGPKLKEVDSTETKTGTRSDRGGISGQGTIGNVAGALSRSLGMPVTDDTGLRGVFHLDLKWTPDPVGNSPLPDPAGGPSIFTAVQEQLGLRLEPRKTSVTTIVIDSAEKPDAN